MLDLPEGEPFAVVVGEVRPLADEAIARVEQVLRNAGLRSTWSVTRHRQIGVVVIGVDRGSLDQVRRILAERATGSAGLSPVYGDLTLTARPVSLADLALCCVPRGDAGVVLFDEQPVGALIARSPELSERIATLVLGPLRRSIATNETCCWAR